MIASATNTVTATIPVGQLPYGVAVTPDGSKVYVVNFGEPGPGTVSVIATATNTVTDTVPVDIGSYGFGTFIQPPPRFAGTPGKSNCYGQSVAALTSQYGGPNSAAAALGFSGVETLQKAILTFCGG